MNNDNDESSISSGSLSINVTDDENVDISKYNEYKKKLKAKWNKIRNLEKLTSRRGSAAHQLSLVSDTKDNTKEIKPTLENTLQDSTGENTKELTPILEDTNRNIFINNDKELCPHSNDTPPVRRRTNGTLLAYKAVVRTSPIKRFSPKNDLKNAPESFTKPNMKKAFDINAALSESSSDEEECTDQMYHPVGSCSSSDSDSEDKDKKGTAKKSINQKIDNKTLTIKKKEKKKITIIEDQDNTQKEVCMK